MIVEEITFKFPSMWYSIDQVMENLIWLLGIFQLKLWVEKILQKTSQIFKLHHNPCIQFFRHREDSHTVKYP